MWTKYINGAVRLMFVLTLCLALGGCVTSWHNGQQVSTVVQSLVVISGPQSVTINAGSNATFTVIATGVGTIKYQWYCGQNAIQGANSASLDLVNVPLTSNGLTYFVKLSDNNGSIQSSNATLNVNPLLPVLVIDQIADQKYSPTPISISATSTSTGSITYSVTSGPAIVNGSTVTLTGTTGTVVICASQLASGNYSAATAHVSFNVLQNVTMSQIVPNNITMAPGNVTFSATAQGGQTNKITWSATGGTLAGTVWSSPDIAGSYLITAQSVDDPSVMATASINISKPIIVKDPQGGSICPGADDTLQVVANYADQYQWYLNGIPLSGVNQSIYYLSSINQSQNSGTYTVIAQNAAGTASSGPAILNVGTKITQNPVNQTVSVGQLATFSIAVSGIGPYTYQWYSIPNNGTPLPISGANSSSYTTPSVDLAMNGTEYYVNVADSCGTSIESSIATLSVTDSDAPPTFTIQPANATVPAGSTTILSANAIGAPTITYQWYWVPAGTSGAGQSIPGANSNAYMIPVSSTAIANDQDQYYAKATNSYGTATSQRATLSIGSGISIQQQPTTKYISAGQTATFTVIASSSEPLSYQWYRASPATSQFTAITGATASSYTTPIETQGDDGSFYYVIVSNDMTASVQSDTAALYVDHRYGIIPCNWSAEGTATVIDACSFQLTSSQLAQSGGIVYPDVISTTNVILSFSATISNTSTPPADGFALVLGDPSLGATPSSVGYLGVGLGAMGIPGLAITFDDFYDSPGVYSNSFPGDPPVPYIGVTRSETDLYENPFYMENSAISQLAIPGESITHMYIINISNGNVSVSMDGQQILQTKANIPSAAYMYITSGTGAQWESVFINNIQVTTMP